MRMKSKPVREIQFFGASPMCDDGWRNRPTQSIRRTRKPRASLSVKMSRLQPKWVAHFTAGVEAIDDGWRNSPKKREAKENLLT